MGNCSEDVAYVTEPGKVDKTNLQKNSIEQL